LAEQHATFFVAPQAYRISNTDGIRRMKQHPRQNLLTIATALEPLGGAHAHATMHLLTLHLRRAIQCAGIDTLTPPTLMLEGIRSDLEARHAQDALPGIRRIRDAIDGLERLLDRLPLARPGAEPTPCLELDLPAGGLVDRVLRGKRRAGTSARRKRAPVKKVAVSRPASMEKARLRKAA
jgi:hypothetical protein